MFYLTNVIDLCFFVLANYDIPSGQTFYAIWMDFQSSDPELHQQIIRVFCVIFIHSKIMEGKLPWNHFTAQIIWYCVRLRGPV